MSEINPVPGSPNYVSLFSGDNFPYVNVPSDTQGAAGTVEVNNNPLLSVQLARPLSLNDFATLLNSSTQSLSEQLWGSQQSDATLLNALYQANVLTIQEVTQQIDLTSIADNMQGITTQDVNGQTTLNSQISTFNSNDSSQISTMNTAITNYNAALTTYQNAGSPTSGTVYDDYKTAVDSYNTSVNTYNNYLNSTRPSDISTLNGHIATYNNNVSTVNGLIVANNIPGLIAADSLPITLTNETNYSGSIPTLPTTSPAGFSQLTLLTQPAGVASAVLTLSPQVTDAQAFIAAIDVNLFNYINSVLASTATSSSNYDDIKTYQSYLQYVLKGTSISLPASYLATVPDVPSNTPSIGLSALGGTISNPKVAQALVYSLLASNQANFSNPARTGALFLPGGVGQFLQTVGARSSLAVLAYLSQNPQIAGDIEAEEGANGPGNNPAVDALLGLSFASQIIQAVNSNSSQSTIQQLLQNSFPSLSATEAQTLSTALSSVQNLSQLQTALSVLGQQLGIPTLFSQVLAAIQGASQTSSPTSVSNILSDNLSVFLLKNQLVNTLISENNTISTTDAQELVNNAVNTALSQSNITTSDQLTAALTQAFTSGGLSSSESSSLAATGTSFVNSEAQSNGSLENNVSSNSVNFQNLANSLAGQSANSSQSTTSPTSESTESSTADNIMTTLQVTSTPISQSTAVTAVVSLATPQDNISLRNIRDQLSTALVNQGVPSSQAITAATQAVLQQNNAAIQVGIQNASIQSQAQATQTASAQTTATANLRVQLRDQIVTQLTQQVGVESARHIANQVLQTVLGNNVNDQSISIAGALQSNLHSLSIANTDKTQGNNQVTLANQLFHDSLKPTYDSYTANQQLMDPAYTSYYSAAPIIYSRKGNANFGDKGSSGITPLV